MPSADETITWTEGNLKFKNLLGPADAQAVESAFAHKLAWFAVETNGRQEEVAESNLNGAARFAAVSKGSADYASISVA